MQLEELDAVQARTFPGRAHAIESATISPRVGGPLVELPIVLGAAVEQDSLIARIDPRDFEAEVRQAENSLAEAEATLRAMRAGARPEEIRAREAQMASAESSLTDARRNYDRVARLFEDQVVSRSDYDAARTRLEVAESSLEEARQALEIARQGAREEDIEATEARVESLRARRDAARDALEDTEIRAPFTGRIAGKYVENHQLVRPQQPIAKLQDYSRLEVRFGVPEAAIIMAGYVSEILCRFETYPGREFPAEIKEIGTEASEETQTYPVTVMLDNPPDAELLPGMTVTVEIRAELPEDSGLAGYPVPGSALVPTTDGEPSLWVYDEEEGTVHRRVVSTGTLTTDGVLVTEGVSAGEWIVTAGANFLSEGQRVRLLDQPGRGAREQ